MKNDRLKIAILCLPGLESFLNDIVQHLKDNHEVLTCIESNPQKIAAAVNWANVVWIEWANEMAVALTNNPTLLKNKYVLCRLHSYEAFVDDYCLKIDWSKVDTLIFIAKHIEGIVRSRVANIEQQVGRIVTIPNGIDIDRLTFKPRQNGYNLAYVGYINYKKGPMLLLQAFHALTLFDNRFKLHIAGKIQDPRYDYYFKQMINEMKLEHNIQFDGWVDDVNDWLQDKHYIISSSVLESQGLGIMEAMACGLKPAIHNFVGAKEIYPENYLWNTIPEFVDHITSDDYNPKEYRDLIQTHYGLNAQLGKIDALLSDVKLESVQSIDVSASVVEDNFKAVDEPVADHATHLSQHIHPQIKGTLDKCIRPGMNVLDIGCKNGSVTAYIAERGATVVGVDPSEKWIERARIESSHPNASYLVAEYGQMRFHQKFDVITIIQVLEYIPENRLPGFIEAILNHATDQVVIYVDIRDGRYIQHRKAYQANHPVSQCEAYSPEVLLAAFSKHGLQPYHIQIYGDDVPAQFNEYLFANETLFQRTYQGA